MKVLGGLEEHPTPTLPIDEISILVHALRSMKENTVLQQPRVVVSQTHSPPKLYVPTRKQKKKFENAEAPAAQYEALIQSYRDQGWDIVYPDGSAEKHPEVGWVGGYGVFFGDQRDVAEFIPPGEDQTNNWGELRAALCSLQGHRTGRRTLICPDALLVVNGVLGWAQRWRRHKWQNALGAVKHLDLWMQILDLVDQLRDTVKWLHVPSHIGIKGNGRADHLADVGRHRSPLLFGRISIHPPAPPPPPADEEPELPDEESIWGWEEGQVSQPEAAPGPGEEIDTPPETQPNTPAKLEPPSPAPLWDIEICTPVQLNKRARITTPGSLIPWSNTKPRGTHSEDVTPVMCRRLTTPHQVGPAHTTFRTPHPHSLLSPLAPVQLLASLELVAMEGEDPLSPRSLAFSASSKEARSDDFAPASPSTASTVLCSTEGSRCFTP